MSSRNLSDVYPPYGATGATTSLDASGFNKNLPPETVNTQLFANAFDQAELGAELWTDITATRTSASVLSATDIQLTLTTGTLVRTADAATRPTAAADWKYHIVNVAGTGTVDIIGEELASGADTFFVEYNPTNIYLRVIPLHVAGFWASVAEAALLENVMGMDGGFVWREKSARVIAATYVSRIDDSSATAATGNVKVNALDLFGTAASITDTVANSGVTATARAIAWGQSIELSCAATIGTDTDSLDLAYVLFAVILEG